MSLKRPLVFIGCSKEGREVAQAIQVELQHTAECVIWWQGVFGLSKGNLESLVNALEKFDFAILVLTPDDLIASRGETQPAPRDNVLLELGMFIGRLTPSRTFMVVDRSAKIKLPSDLAGVNPASFEPPHGGTLQSALGPACTEIGIVISNLGPRNPVPVSIQGLASMSIYDGKSINFHVTNLLTEPFPPYRIALYHPKIGSFFVFPSEKEGPLLHDQRREHKCMFGQRTPEGFVYFPDLNRDRNGNTLNESDDREFAMQLVLEDSDKILYEHKRIARFLVKLLRNAKQSGDMHGGAGSDWAELNNRLPDE